MATAQGPGPIPLTVAGPTAFGFDFNPAVDRIRVVTNVGENLRLNPNNGLLAGTDTAIGPAGAVVSGAGYTNNFAQTLTGTPTTLYTLDAANNRLAIQTPPNNGVQTDFHTVTVGGSTLDFSATNGFDIPNTVFTATPNAAVTGKAFAALTVGGTTSLYTIELSDGTAVSQGTIGNGLADMVGLAIGEGPLTPTTVTVTTPITHVGFGEEVTLTATVVPAGATGNVTFFADGVMLGTVAIVNGQASLMTSTLTVGLRAIGVTYQGSLAHGTGQSPALDVTTGNFRPHFAEGATGFFQTTIGVFNASATKTANVTLKRFPEGAATIADTFVLAPLTRLSLDVNDIMSDNGLAGGVSTLIEADQPIAATRQMTWGSPLIWGSSLESGVPDTDASWFFAEGATGVFSLYFLIENPQSTAANVTFTHLLEGGGAPIVYNATVDPFARRTFYINDVRAPRPGRCRPSSSRPSRSWPSGRCTSTRPRVNGKAARRAPARRPSARTGRWRKARPDSSTHICCSGIPAPPT